MTAKIKSEIILVTPEMAKKYLLCNEQNRRVRQGWVNYLAYLIRHGEWKVTHQGIAFSDKDRLLDGQHRLLAIIKANIPTNVMVSSGFDESVFSAIDDGMKRTAEDLTRLPKRLTECAKFFLDVMNFEGVDGIPSEKKGGFAGRATPEQVRCYSEVIREFYELIERKAGSSRTVFATVPGKCAVIANLMMGEDIEYVLDLYRNCILLKFEVLPPIAGSAVRQALNKSMSTRGGASVRVENFCRLLPVYKKANKDIQKLILRDRNERLEEVRKELRPWFARKESVEIETGSSQKTKVVPLRSVHGSSDALGLAG